MKNRFSPWNSGLSLLSLWNTMKTRDCDWFKVKLKRKWWFLLPSDIWSKCSLPSLRWQGHLVVYLMAMDISYLISGSPKGILSALYLWPLNRYVITTCGFMHCCLRTIMNAYHDIWL
jgi:hypothetical protein